MYANSVSKLKNVTKSNIVFTYKNITWGMQGTISGRALGLVCASPGSDPQHNKKNSKKIDNLHVIKFKPFMCQWMSSRAKE